MSKIEVNEIVKSSGSTLTLGGSGTAVTLGSGATQTGFGRTGTVDWVTTKKTGDFTAVSGEGYFIDTSSSTITMTLPASPTAGSIVAINDYATYKELLTMQHYKLMDNLQCLFMLMQQKVGYQQKIKQQIIMVLPI